MKVPISTYKFRSRPSGNGRGGGHPDPEIGEGAVSKKFISALWASVWSKNKGGGGRPPLDPPLKFFALNSIHFLEEL